MMHFTNRYECVHVGVPYRVKIDAPLVRPAPTLPDTSASSDKHERVRLYLITNKVNGKRYVGQTTRTVEARWKQHCWPQNRNGYMQNSIKKYGRDAFTVEELAVVDSCQKADAMEMYYRLQNNCHPLKAGSDDDCKNPNVEQSKCQPRS